MRGTDVPQIGSEAYFRQLCQHMGIALIGTDLDLNIRIWNLSAVRMFGAAADRMIGTPISLVIPEERRTAAEQMLRRAIDTGQSFQFEFQYHDSRGKRRELTGTIAPVLSESGVCMGTSLWVRDITRRIALEDELHESRKMVALGELAGAVAHHFNNILGGVITSVDYANASNDPRIVRRVLEQITGALHRATGLIQGLQAFAEGYQRTTELGDFSAIVTEFGGEIERLVETKSIEFTLTLPELPDLQVPRVQVATILGNVTRNAVEAMPRGGKLGVEVSLDDKWIVTRVIDTGCGLDENAISRIFEPFWSTKREFCSSTGNGVGLGLAIAHGILQVIGGTITVSSEPEKGSSFTISIPRPDKKEDDQQ